ncbi:MAG: hypothetical protein ACI4OT_04840 [Bacilli bacterium]
MNELTYQELYFLIISHKLSKNETISKEELEAKFNELKKDYHAMPDFISSNSIEELIDDHKDLLSLEEDDIKFQTNAYIQSLELFVSNSSYLYGDIYEHIKEQKEKNKIEKLNIINDKYLTNVPLKIKREINKKLKNKVLIKTI